jgi:outer membrane immunogenic protein
LRSAVAASGVATFALLASMAARAADLPPAPAPMPRAPAAYIPAPPPFSWTGFYIGGNVGVGWPSGSITDSFGGNYNTGGSAVFAGGGQVGGNYQFGSFVAGVEADFEWLANNKNSGNGTVVGAPPQTIQVSANDRWVTTLAARFGFAMDHALFYGKAGGGWVGAGNFAVTNLTTPGSIAVSNSNTNSGWLLGAGFEYAFTQNWTAKVEYDYLALSNANYTVTLPVLGPDTFTNGGRSIQTLTVGVNYLFNGF